MIVKDRRVHVKFFTFQVSARQEKLYDCYLVDRGMKSRRYNI